MAEIEAGSYLLHKEFNSAHKTVRQYNWIVNEIKECVGPVPFDVIVAKVQSAFAIKPDNDLNIPTRDQVVEGLAALLNDGLIVRSSDTN